VEAGVVTWRVILLSMIYGMWKVNHPIKFLEGGEGRGRLMDLTEARALLYAD
jgi:hypothetical protein